MTDQKPSLLSRIGITPIQAMMLLLILVGGPGGTAIVSSYLGIDTEDVQQEIKAHDIDVKAMADSITKRIIRSEAGSIMLSEAIGEDVSVLKGIVEYGKQNMEKQVEYDAWRGRVDEALEMKDTGCGAFYYEGPVKIYRDCEFGDLRVQYGAPIDREDIVWAEYVLTPAGYTKVFPQQSPIKYDESRRIFR